uniref:Retrotransposon gag domain-containing protein n=1 Tax=Cacopsylla melanoneura TaxID=428564 RepID=A0A8D9E414_9HEMI
MDYIVSKISNKELKSLLTKYNLVSTGEIPELRQRLLRVLNNQIENTDKIEDPNLTLSEEENTSEQQAKPDFAEISLAFKRSEEEKLQEKTFTSQVLHDNTLDISSIVKEFEQINLSKTGPNLATAIENAEKTGEAIQEIGRKINELEQTRNVQQDLPQNERSIRIDDLQTLWQTLAAEKKKETIRVNPIHFNGKQSEDVEKFITSFSTAIQANNWDQNDSMNYIGNFLKGAASDALENFSSQVPNASVEDVFDYLRLHFQTNKYYDTKAQLENRIWNETESVFEYITDVLRLCRLIDNHTTEREQIRNVVKGLSLEMIDKITILKPNTLNELLDHVKAIQNADEIKKQRAMKTQPTKQDENTNSHKSNVQNKNNFQVGNNGRFRQYVPTRFQTNDNYNRNRYQPRNNFKPYQPRNNFQPRNSFQPFNSPQNNFHNGNGYQPSPEKNTQNMRAQFQSKNS